MLHLLPTQQQKARGKHCANFGFYIYSRAPDSTTRAQMFLVLNFRICASLSESQCMKCLRKHIILSVLLSVPARFSVPCIIESRLTSLTVLVKKKLQPGLQCVNDAPGPGGFSPTMLVYRLIPKLHMPHRHHSSLDARVRTIREQTMLVRRLKAQRVRQKASRRKHVPNLEHIRALENLITG